MTLPSQTGRSRYPATRETAPRTLTLRDEINRLFDDFMGFGSPWGGASMLSTPMREFIPNVDVTDMDGEVKVTAELPGMAQDDVNVELEEDMLTISGEKKQEEEEEEGGRTWRESSYGSFVRQIPLPAHIDAKSAKASFKNGRLRVTLPKAQEEESRRQKIAVES